MQNATQQQTYRVESAGKSRRTVGVIGAGAVGICAASWLLRDGHDVLLIDPEGIGTGASFGNAGCLNSSSVVPMSLPGTAWKVPGWLLDPLGPLAIRPSYLPRLAPWLVRFLRAAKPALVRSQAQALTGLLADAPGAYAPLVGNAGAQDLLRHNGHIVAYRTQQDFDGDRLGWQLRRDAGIRFDVLDESELWQMEPAISRDYRLGVLVPDNAYTVNPQALVRALGECFLRDGGRICNAKVLDFSFAGEALQGVLTDQGQITLDAVVLAAGAHSRVLAEQAGDKVMLDTERGYHVMIKDPEAMPRHSILDATGKFVATPMQDGLRLAGTVEFAGLQAPPDWRRADRLQTLGRRLFPALQASYPEARLSRWMGFRPSMPDSLPVIGTARRSGNIIYAFGHGHIGLASAARTGRLVAELVGGRAPHVDIAPFSAQRFSQ
jgi:D-amino-acid dehydrogenase